MISDIQFPRDGKSDSTAGIELARLMKSESSDLPVLLQSSDQAKAEQAEARDAAFLNKQSPRLLNKLGSFINENFGFGDFVFKSREGKELARAASFRQMQKCISSVDSDSLVFHAEANHFSNWLIARGVWARGARSPDVSSRAFAVRAAAESVLSLLRSVGPKARRAVA